MSDQKKTETHSWQIEFKSGSSTRIDGVTDAPNLVAEDVVELFDGDGARVFAAPFSSITYMKRIEPLVKGASAGGVNVTYASGGDVEAAVRRVLNDPRFRGLA